MDAVLTENLLKAIGTDEETINFLKRNNLLGNITLEDIKGDLSYLELTGIPANEITVITDNNGNKLYKVQHIGDNVSLYDENAREIHYKGVHGYEDKRKYDENGNLIYFTNSDGYEEWLEYDSRNNLIFMKNSEGHIDTYKYIYGEDGKLRRVVMNDETIVEFRAEQD